MRNPVLRRLTLAACILWANSAAFSAVLSITPANTIAAVGDTFFLHVDVANVSNLYAFEFDITYDPLMLSAGNITEGNFLAPPTFFVPGTVDPTTGIISQTANTLVGPVAGSSGSGRLASFAFTILRDGFSPVGLDRITLLDNNLVDILATGQNATVSTIPEPASFGVMAAALFGCALLRSRRLP